MPTEKTIEITPEPAPPAPETEAAPKAPWRAPTLTRIDLKRTMKGSGQFADQVGSSLG